MNIGQAIKTLRQKRNMTQGDLASRIGMSVNAVSSWELGKTFPPKESIHLVCEAFDIPESYLMLACLEEKHVPEEKRADYRALVDPLKNILLEKGDEK